jgi:hypothetical protein
VRLPQETKLREPRVPIDWAAERRAITPRLLIRGGVMLGVLAVGSYLLGFGRHISPLASPTLGVGGIAAYREQMLIYGFRWMGRLTLIGSAAGGELLFVAGCLLGAGKRIHQRVAP